MADDLVVIRTFASPLEADYALALLRAAGLSSLLLTQESVLESGTPGSDMIALAVHSRDADRAEEALTGNPAEPPGPAA